MTHDRHGSVKANVYGVRPLFCAWLACAAAVGAGQNTAAGERPEDAGPIPLYVKCDSLQETMLATRARYLSWSAEQAVARQGLLSGPWQATSLLRVGDGYENPLPCDSIDLEAKGPDGKLLWRARPEWKDGQVVNLGNKPGHPVVCYLTRTITAPRATTLAAGIGGGDRIDVWLNGEQVRSCSTCLSYGRYGCATVLDGDRRDQVLVNLPLVAGENRLVICVYQQTVAPGARCDFCYGPMHLSQPHTRCSMW